jgi:hypothetical protein
MVTGASRAFKRSALHLIAGGDCGGAKATESHPPPLLISSTSLTAEKLKGDTA